MLNFYTTTFPIIFITIILFHLFNRFILIKVFENIINKNNNINNKQLNHLKSIYYSLFAIDHLLINISIPVSMILCLYILENYKDKTFIIIIIHIITIISSILYGVILRVYYCLVTKDDKYHHHYYNVANEFKFYKIAINNVKLFIENKITNSIISKDTNV